MIAAKNLTVVKQSIRFFIILTAINGTRGYATLFCNGKL